MQTAGFTWWVKSVYLSFNGACLHFSDFVKCGAFSLKVIGPDSMVDVGGWDSWSNAIQIRPWGDSHGH